MRLGARAGATSRRGPSREERYTWPGAARTDEAARPTARPTAHADDEAALPPRPSLPPTLGCALSLWACCAVCYLAARGLDVEGCLAVAAVGLACAVPPVVALWRRRAPMACAVALGAALGVACAAGAGASLHLAEQTAVGQSGTWRFVAVDDAASGDYGYTCLAKTKVEGVGEVVVLLQLDDEVEPPRFGDVLVANATLISVSETSAAYRWRQGVAARANVTSAEYCERSDLFGAVVSVRNAAVDLIRGAGEGDGAAILAALVCGWREDLDASEVYDDFKVCGLAHLVAVSGAHLSIVCASVASLLRLLRVPRAAATGLQLALLLCYLVLAAMPASAVRAAVMATAGMFSYTARRRPAALGALSLCMIACIAADPATALSVSFALSALSTLGIVVFAGLAGAWIERLARPVPRALRDAVSLTCSSSLMATPLSAALFAQVPLVAPLANAVAAPLFPLVCAGGLAAVVLSLAVPPLSGPLMPLATGGAGLLGSLVSLLAAIPHAALPAEVPVAGALALSALAAAALWALWPRPDVRVAAVGACASAAALAALFIFVPTLGGTQIVMLDVGQGDAFLVRSEGVAVLIDTGNQDSMLLSALARHGVTHLDALIVTHGDDDHMGSMSALSGVVEVDEVLLAADTFTCGCDSCEELLAQAEDLAGEGHVQALSVGDEVGVGAFEMEVVWPASFSDEGGNADSLCLLARADVDGDAECDWTALFVGDAECDQLQELIDSGAVGEVDIYKVGHHGSKNALDEEVAEALSAKIALVSVGENNSYGHPADSTIEALEDSGASVLRTDEAGDVSCTLKADEIVVTTQD